ncbi:hypothetical protein B6375_22555 [Salmonella enterica subsp. enterica serovar Give]|nr:hypothetical protein [Salmonella enterica subsp. enterica serovar Give]
MSDTLRLRKLAIKIALVFNIIKIKSIDIHSQPPSPTDNCLFYYKASLCRGFTSRNAFSPGALLRCFCISNKYSHKKTDAFGIGSCGLAIGKRVLVFM